MLFFLISCEKEDSLSENLPPVNFEVTQNLFPDKTITCIDFSNDGTAWLGSGQELICYKMGDTTTFDVGYNIVDISAGIDDKIWLATKENGLGCFSDNQFIFYNEENSGLPRNYIADVEAAPDGTVWFSSSAHQLGGLVHFTGQEFELYTPENSILNQNLVLGIRVDAEGNVFCFSAGTVTETKVFKIDLNGNWKSLGDNFYWVASMDLTSKSEPVVLTDHSLSSCMGCYEDYVAIFKKSKWVNIEFEFESGYVNNVLVDNRDYIWIHGLFPGGIPQYCVYNGKEWLYSEDNQLGDAFVYKAACDSDNNIWICTNKGIFILNQ